MTYEEYSAMSDEQKADYQASLLQQAADAKVGITALAAAMRGAGEVTAGIALALDDENARLREQNAELVEALETARDALSRCYDVTEWPADGTSSQDAALRVVEATLAAAKGGK